MTKEELVVALAALADDWETVAEERRDDVVRAMIALLLLEPDVSRANLRYLFAEALRQASFPDLQVQERLRLIRQVYPDARLRPQDAERVTAALEQRLDEMASRVGAAVTETLLGGGGDAEQLQAAESATERATQAFEGYTSAMLSVVDRVILSTVPEAVYEYLGPADNRNRPFCARIVREKRLFTREGVETLNAHPLLNIDVPPNVFSRCGGYKCRHVWMPLSEAERGLREARGWTVVKGEGE